MYSYIQKLPYTKNLACNINLQKPYEFTFNLQLNVYLSGYRRYLFSDIVVQWYRISYNKVNVWSCYLLNLKDIGKNKTSFRITRQKNNMQGKCATTRYEHYVFCNMMLFLSGECEHKKNSILFWTRSIPFQLRVSRALSLSSKKYIFAINMIP